MKAFARLYAELDETTRTNDKVDALVRYFSASDPADAAWAVHFLIGRRPRRLIPARRLAGWAMELAGVPEWLFAECYEAVGDLAEAMTLLLPTTHGEGSTLPLRDWVQERLLALRGEDEVEQRRVLQAAWRELTTAEAYVWNKLITGGFRVGVSQNLVVRALARTGGVDEATIAHRLMGVWEPTPEFFTRLFEPDTRDSDLSRPYPFFLAYPLEAPLETLGESTEWQIEWKWDGIRAQLIRRGGRTFLWSRGEELITERFPELAEAASLLRDGTVLDGEILPWRGEAPLPFAQLQRRIGRKSLGPKILAEVPVVLVCYDLLEWDGEDMREHPLSRRRRTLEEMLAAAPGALRERLLLSPVAVSDQWAAVEAAYEAARERAAEGLMLKRADSPYRVGRRRGDWWKWKVELMPTRQLSHKECPPDTAFVLGQLSGLDSIFHLTVRKVQPFSVCQWWAYAGPCQLT